MHTLTYILWDISQHLDARDQATTPVVDGKGSRRLCRRGRRRQKRRRTRGRRSNFLNVSAERGHDEGVRRPDVGTEQIDNAAASGAAEATEGPRGRPRRGRGRGRRTGEHLPVRQGRLGLGSGDTNAEPAEAVDNQCVDRHGGVITATRAT